MEQQLINAMMKLFSKAGGGALIKDLIQQVDQTGNPKIWTDAEIRSATEFINRQTENFGIGEASTIVETLRKKYHLSHSENEINLKEELPEVPGVLGLR